MILSYHIYDMLIVSHSSSTEQFGLNMMHKINNYIMNLFNSCLNLVLKTSSSVYFTEKKTFKHERKVRTK